MRKFNKVDSQIEYADIKYIGQSNYTCGNHIKQAVKSNIRKSNKVVSQILDINVHGMLQRMEMFHKGNRSKNNTRNFRIK